MDAKPVVRGKTKRRDEILAALGRVIARDGVAAASVGTVAQEANVARGALHYYFGSTQELVRALVEQRRSDESARLSELPAGGDVRERLRRFVDALVHPSVADRVLDARLGIALAGFAVGDKVAARTLAEQRQRRLDVAADLVADGVRSKVFAVPDAVQAASQLVSLCDGHLFATAVAADASALDEGLLRAAAAIAGLKDGARG